MGHLHVMYLFVRSEVIIIIHCVILMCRALFTSNLGPKEWMFWRNFKIGSRTTSENILEDAYLTTSELIVKYKYKAETHYTTTEDGYILGVHRIVNRGKQPILLQHGLVDSSATFIIMGPENGLGYYLADNGYDVWLGNSRGNRYSRNHTTLNPEESKFWDFSWHEVGVYDLPATIDYILNTTGFEKLYYIGHSQGTTAFFVMCSKLPEYNEKIILMQALAPAVFLSHNKSPFLPVGRVLLNSLKNIPSGELFPYGFFQKTPCLRGNVFQLLCLEVFFSVVGRDSDGFNNTLAPVIFSHTPAGSSIQQFRHYFQLIDSGDFAEYNYGDSENLRRYGQVQPPKYNLSEVLANVILHYGKNDYLANHVDVEKLYKSFANVRGLYTGKNAKFNHVDFLWNINVKNLVNKRILSIMRKFEAGTLEYVVE